MFVKYKLCKFVRYKLCKFVQDKLCKSQGRTWGPQGLRGAYKFCILQTYTLCVSHIYKVSILQTYNVRNLQTCKVCSSTTLKACILQTCNVCTLQTCKGFIVHTCKACDIQTLANLQAPLIHIYTLTYIQTLQSCVIGKLQTSYYNLHANSAESLLCMHSTSHTSSAAYSCEGLRIQHEM